jgi:hypothetical protein
MFASIINVVRVLMTGDFQGPMFGWLEDETVPHILYAVHDILTSLL